MKEQRDFIPISTLIGMPVLSLTSGNRLGQVSDLLVDHQSGIVTALSVSGDPPAELPYDEIYSFGPDAVMASSDTALKTGSETSGVSHAHEHLIGTKVITASGKLLGQISNIFITLQTPPTVIYEVREGLLDKLLGRQLYILSSAGYALSSDAARLVISDESAAMASTDLHSLLDENLSVRTFDPSVRSNKGTRHDDDTLLVHTASDEGDETVVRLQDDDETVLRRRPSDHRL